MNERVIQNVLKKVIKCNQQKLKDIKKKGEKEEERNHNIIHQFYHKSLTKTNFFKIISLKIVGVLCFYFKKKLYFNLMIYITKFDGYEIW